MTAEVDWPIEIVRSVKRAKPINAELKNISVAPKRQTRPQFWRLINRYPLTEHARGCFMALDMEGERDDKR